MVAVIFIDLAGSSRAPQQRAELQRALLALRDRHNETYRDRLIAPFDVVWGDELKGVLTDPRPVWDVYRSSFELLDGIPFYFSVGFGTIDTSAGYEPSRNINLLDGTAFKAARDAMDRLKHDASKRKDSKKKEQTPYRVRFASAGSPHFAEALNAFVGVLNDLVQHMTASQRRHFVREFPWNGSLKARSETKASAASPDAPASLSTGAPRDASSEVSRQSAWETLQRARVDAYRAATRGIEALLQLAREHEAITLPRLEEAGP